jgi:hypothetical protein
MGEVKYQVAVSVSGNTVATIEAADPTTAQEAIRLFAQRFGTVARSLAPSPAQQIQSLFPKPESVQTQAPICGVHGRPMTWVTSRGGFWSCHRKNSDGSWCKFKPIT